MPNCSIPRRFHYLGPEGTFTEQAAKSLAERLGMPWEAVPCSTLHQAIHATVQKKGWAVLPYYNLYEGLVQETLDLITEERLTILAAERVPIRFAIGEQGNLEKLAEIDKANKVNGAIFSHPKALQQCSEYLQKNLPELQQNEVDSTAAAVVRIAESRCGLAIARRETLEKYGVPVLADDIGNRPYGRSNFTEFLLIGRAGDVAFPTESDSSRRRSMIALIPMVDRVGLLADILGQIAFFGINLLKIHSRPALSEHETRNDPQMFYLEMEIRSESREFRLCRETLEMRLAHGGTHPSRSTADGVVRLLGDYPLFG